MRRDARDAHAFTTARKRNCKTQRAAIMDRGPFLLE
jgi:hypothetical protein